MICFWQQYNSRSTKLQVVRNRLMFCIMPLQNDNLYALWCSSDTIFHFLVNSRCHMERYSVECQSIQSLHLVKVWPSSPPALHAVYYASNLLYKTISVFKIPGATMRSTQFDKKQGKCIDRRSSHMRNERKVGHYQSIIVHASVWQSIVTYGRVWKTLRNLLWLSEKSVSEIIKK